jgi:hypothetical protein
MYEKFIELYGEVDVILVPGDMVGHGVTPHIGEDEDNSGYLAMLNNM